MPKAKTALQKKSSAAPKMAPRKTALVFKPADDPLADLELRVGKHIRELRLAKGLSLTELAAKVEISVGNLSEIERGLSVPSIRTLCLLSKALDAGCGPAARAAAHRQQVAGARDGRAGEDDTFNKLASRRRFRDERVEPRLRIVPAVGIVSHEEVSPPMRLDVRKSSGC